MNQDCYIITTLIVMCSDDIARGFPRGFPDSQPEECAVYFVASMSILYTHIHNILYVCLL